MITYSIIQKSQLEGAHRIDAEYYQPEYFIDFSKGKWLPIKSVISKCQYGISQAMAVEKIGYPIFRMNDIKNAFLLDDEVKYIDLDEKLFAKFKIEKDDVLFNRVNAENFVGRTGIFKLSGDYTFASYLIRLKVGREDLILPDYLNIFLSSSYGIKQIRKFRRRAVNQANVNAEELKQIKIAVLPLNVQKDIAKLSNESWQNIEQSKSLYSQAENLLLEELGLKDFKPEEDLSYVVNLSDVKSAQRVDAEYFQPKYEELISKIKHQKLKVELKSLEEITQFLNHAKQPPYIDSGEIPIVTQRHLGENFINVEAINEYETKFTNSNWLKKHLKCKLNIGDILYYSVGAYIGKTNIVLEKLNATAASFITIIRTKGIVDPVYLTVVLNSIIGQLQSKKWQAATAQQYIYPKNIKNFVIPILPKLTQQKIANLVCQSHQARKKAKELLEEAKQKVEKMILGEVN